MIFKIQMNTALLNYFSYLGSGLTATKDHLIEKLNQFTVGYHSNTV